MANGILPTGNQGVTKQQFPLRRTLAESGITRKNEQDLIMQYARPYGAYDQQNDELFITRPMAQQLMQKASQDRDFNNQIDSVRVANLDDTLQKSAAILKDPRARSQMAPEELQHVADLWQKTNAFKQELLQRTAASIRIAEGQSDVETEEQRLGQSPQREPMANVQGIPQGTDVQGQMRTEDRGDDMKQLTDRLTLGGIL